MRRAISHEEHKNSTIDDMVEWNFFADKEFERFFKDLSLDDRPNAAALYVKSRNKEDEEMSEFVKRYVTVIWVIVREEVPIDVKNVLAEEFEKYMRLHRGGYIASSCVKMGYYFMHGLIKRYEETGILQVLFEQHANKSDFVIYAFHHEAE